jgi:ribulose-phosphate 3-epimerase
LQKVAEVKELLLDSGSSALIEVDGGVSQANAAALVQAGADVLVAGSFVFKSPGGPVATLAGLRQLLREAGQEQEAKN